MLEIWRSGRRLSDGASEEFKKTIQRASQEKNLPTWNRTVRNTRSSQTYITCLIDDLQWALTNLGATTNTTIPMKDIETMAIFIHESQSGEDRGYHNVGRVFEVSAVASPIQVLAAFFRNTISHFVDGELSPMQEELLENCFLPNTLQVNPQLYEDKILRMVAEIFGYEPGKDLEPLIYRWRHGMDVFLSAIVAVRFLSPLLSKKHIAELVACLQGSIPFRELVSNPDDKNLPPIEALYHRLSKVNEEHDLDFSDSELELCCQQAADLHNRFLGNFATTNPNTFLDYIWSLLPEQYHKLRRQYLYSLDDFYFAVFDMHNFMGKLRETVNYMSFHEVPPPSEINEFQKLFHKNYDMGTKYLKIRSTGIGIIVAIATLTGGASVPKSFFFGDLRPHERAQTTSLGENLPKMTELPLDCSVQLYEILREGRNTECSFDQRNGPVAAYLYGALGDSGIDAAFQLCTYPMTEKDSWKILHSLPFDLVESIGHAVASVAVPRATAVIDLLTKLSEST